MKAKLRIAAVVLGLLLVALASPVNAEVDAGGAILIEGSSGRVLYAENENERLEPASTTKVMTALIAIERGCLDDIVEVADEAVGTEGSSMYLDYGELVSLRDLLYGLMLTSGNDAAVAIAIHIAGSVADFAQMMNEKARALGCENTHFITPNGLHDAEHYTTAHDLAKICAEAMKNETFREIVATEYHVTEGGSKSHTLKNKNRLLWEYEGGCGIKTGYTTRSGKCLCFAAERDGMLLIGVVLRCPDMWNASKELLSLGFSNYGLGRLAEAGQSFGMIAVAGGIKKELCVVLEHDIIYPVSKDEADRVELECRLSSGVTAPVEAGDAVGSVSLVVNGQVVGSFALVAAESVPKADFLYYCRMIAENWTA